MGARKVEECNDETVRKSQMEATAQSLQLLEELEEIFAQIKAGIESGELRLEDDSES